MFYADHYSDFFYIHLIFETTSLETLLSKHAYEWVAKSYGVKMKSYRADNLRFNDTNFKGDHSRAGQDITYYEAGTHRQNTVTESKIKEVCYTARTILIHATRKPPHHNYNTFKLCHPGYSQTT